MAEKPRGHGQFYGSTVVSAKGQVVIPAEARRALGLANGDKLLVFGPGRDLLVLAKVANVERYVTHLSRHLDAIRGILHKSKAD
jgi:AbrB family looped-hinge helix DNA binding protein